MGFKGAMVRLNDSCPHEGIRGQACLKSHFRTGNHTTVRLSQPVLLAIQVWGHLHGGSMIMKQPPPPIAREIFQGTNVSALLIALQCKEGL